MSWDDDVGDKVSWGEAIDLVEGLRTEFGTHIFTAEAGWSFPAGYGDLMAALNHRAYLQVNFESGADGVPLPWTISTGQEVVSAEERRIAEEYLAKHTAIRS